MVPKLLTVPPQSERELSNRLRAHGNTPAGEFPILQAALDTAAYARVQADQPLPDYAPVVETVNALSADAGEWLAIFDQLPVPEEQVDWLRKIIHAQGGFQGDVANYESPQNADIAEVIMRRKGLPVALGILYIHIGRVCCFDVEGLNFPGHFVLRTNAAPSGVIFDPFDAAKILQPQDLRHLVKRSLGPDAEMKFDYTAPVPDREILFRLQNNLKVRALRAGNLEDAVLVLERLLLLDPGNGNFWQEAGLAYQRMGNLRAAMLALENAVETMQEPAESLAVQSLLDDVVRQLN